MKYLVPEELLKFANKAASFRGLKTLLKPLYYSYKRYLLKKRKEYFQKHAKDVLEQFDKALDGTDFFYTLAFGTLLGAVREKGFIKHDLDIDVFMWKEDWSPSLKSLLKQNGFKLLHTFLVENGKLGREETYEKNDVSIDIFYIFPPIDKTPYCCDFMAYSDSLTFRSSMKKYGRVVARRIELPVKKERIRTVFDGINVFIPTNYKEILSARYGLNYMTPNPNWSDREPNNYIKEWKDQFSIMIE